MQAMSLDHVSDSVRCLLMNWYSRLSFGVASILLNSLLLKQTA